MKNLALVFAVCFLAAPLLAQQGAAGSPASKQDVERFFQAMHTRELMASTMQAVARQEHQMIHQMAIKSPNLPPDFEAREDKQLDETLRNFPIDELLAAMVPVYEKHFTKGDMDACTAFYSSPEGQKLVRELPAVTADAMQATQPIIQRMIAQAMQRVKEDAAVASRNGGSSQ